MGDDRLDNDEQLGEIIRNAFRTESFPQDLQQVRERVRQLQDEVPSPLPDEQDLPDSPQLERLQRRVELELEQLRAHQRDVADRRLELEGHHEQPLEVDSRLAVERLRVEAELHRLHVELEHRERRLVLEMEAERNRQRHQQRLTGLLLAALALTLGAVTTAASGSTVVTLIGMVMALILGVALVGLISMEYRWARRLLMRQQPQAARRRRARAEQEDFR